MTSAVFEAHVRELDRIKALAALQMADVIMLPHVTASARKEWFRMIAKRLLPKFRGNNVISFNGQIIKTGNQLKRAFRKFIPGNNTREDVA